MAWRLFAIGQAGFSSPPRAGTAAVPVTVSGPSPRRRQPMRPAHRHHRLGRAADAADGGHARLGGHGDRPRQHHPGPTSSRASAVARPGGHGGNPPPLNRPEYRVGRQRADQLPAARHRRRRGPRGGADRHDPGGQRRPETRSGGHDLGPARHGLPAAPGSQRLPRRALPEQDQRADHRAEREPGAVVPGPAADQGEACGLRTLERTIGLYLGIPIQYYATIDLEGFTHLIDEVGPLTLCLPGKLVDRHYNGRATRGPAARGRAARRLHRVRRHARPGVRAGAQGLHGDARWHPGPAGRLQAGRPPAGGAAGAARDFAEMDLFFDLPDVAAEAIGVDREDRLPPRQGRRPGLAPAR